MDRDGSLALVGFVGLLAYLASRSGSSYAAASPYGSPQAPYGDANAGSGAWWNDYTGPLYVDSGNDYSAPNDYVPAPLPANTGASWTEDYYGSDQVNEPDSGSTTASDQIWTPPASAAPYLQTITAAETKYDIPPMLLARLLYQESRFRPDIISGAVKSSAGAIGIAQFMPATARDLGVNPYNPTDSIFAAAKYLRSLYNQTGSWTLALAAYNWGIGNVLKYGIASAPVETQNYIAQITADVGVA